MSRGLLKYVLPVPLLGLPAALLVGWWLPSSSLPLLDGSMQLNGLGGPATLVRDDQGVVTARAGSMNDLAFVIGFAHAQDRCFHIPAGAERSSPVTLLPGRS